MAAFALRECVAELAAAEWFGLGVFVALSLAVDLVVPPWGQAGWVAVGAVTAAIVAAFYSLAPSVFPACSGRLAWLLHYYVDNPAEM